MSSKHLTTQISVITALLLTLRLKAQAFDPVTAALALDTTNKVLEKADEASSALLSLSSLLSDLGVKTDYESSLTSSLESLEKSVSTAQNLKEKSTALMSAESEIKSGRDLQARLESMKRAVRISKDIAGLYAARPKVAEKALSVQTLKIDSMILEELQSIRRAEYLKSLEERNYQLKREILLSKIVKEESKLLNLNRRKRL